VDDQRTVGGVEPLPKQEVFTKEWVDYAGIKVTAPSLYRKYLPDYFLENSQ